MNEEETRQSRKSLVGFAIALMIGAGFAVVMSSTSSLLDQGVEAPAFELATPDGERHSLASHRGKVVLLDFWSTTCPPCVRQLSELEEIYQSSDRDDLVILGINTEGAPPDLIARFAHDRGVRYPVLVDNGTVTSVYQVNQLPTIYLVDREGRVRWSGVGFTPRERLDALIREAL